MVKIFETNEDDLPVIQSLAHRIWPDTFGNILTSEQIAYMLDWMYSLESLKEQVNEKKFVFILAKEGEEAVGFMGYEFNIENSGKTKVHKIYILPDRQGKGIGKRLFDYVSKESLSHGCNILSLNVNRENPAVGMYKKLGFEIVKQEDIPIGNGFFMNDYVMEKEIQ